MQLRTGLLSAFTLGTAIAFGAAAMAADMPKEGKYNAIIPPLARLRLLRSGKNGFSSLLTKTVCG